MKPEHYKEIFSSDSGTLLDIMIFDVNMDDWRHVLHYLSSNYVTVYTQDGVQIDMPDIADIQQRRGDKSITLEIMLSGFTINCHFISDDVIEMDILPDDVDSLEKAQEVFRLMINISALLGKQVFLVPEFGTGTSEQIRALAIAVANPGDHSITSRLTENE